MFENMEELWRSICAELNVAEAVTEIWLLKLEKKYSEPHRCYHNESNMLTNKLEYVRASSKCIKVATIFQYFEYNSKKNCVEQNCEAFKEFVKDGQITDVN